MEHVLVQDAFFLGVLAAAIMLLALFLFDWAFKTGSSIRIISFVLAMLAILIWVIPMYFELLLNIVILWLS